MAARDDEVNVVRDRRRDFGDTLVRIRVLRVPESETYPEGIKHAYHHGEKSADTPILRYDNHHGVHERKRVMTWTKSSFPATSNSSADSPGNCPTRCPPEESNT
jgi:hypothetical protein